MASPKLKIALKLHYIFHREYEYACSVHFSFQPTAPRAINKLTCVRFITTASGFVRFANRRVWCYSWMNLRRHVSRFIPEVPTALNIQYVSNLNDKCLLLKSIIGIYMVESYVRLNMMSTEKKPLRGRLQKKNPPRWFRPPNPPKISHGRHWGVVRRAMIWTFRVCAWKFRRVRNSGVTGFGPKVNVKTA